MVKNSKCCNDDYKNLANVISNSAFPSSLNTEEAAPLYSIDSLDWTISNDTLTLICLNSGVWNVSAVYQVKALDVGLGKMKCMFNINGNDFKTTANVATILTPIDSDYIPDNSSQQVILCIGLVQKFNKGDKLQFMAKSANQSIPTSTVLNIEVTGVIVTMIKR